MPAGGICAALAGRLRQSSNQADTAFRPRYTLTFTCVTPAPSKVPDNAGSPYPRPPQHRRLPLAVLPSSSFHRAACCRVRLGCLKLHVQHLSRSDIGCCDENLWRTDVGRMSGDPAAAGESGDSLRAIGRSLGRSASTIIRERRRVGSKDARYKAQTAHRHSQRCRTKPRVPRKLDAPALMPQKGNRSEHPWLLRAATKSRRQSTAKPLFTTRVQWAVQLCAAL
jgi:hypothetical protein